MDEIDVFFELGAPGIIEAHHTDVHQDEQVLVGEFIDTDKSHGKRGGSITQSQPHFKMPEIHAQGVDVDDVIEINGQVYQVEEKLTVQNGIVLIYLVEQRTGGDHRWQ